MFQRQTMEERSQFISSHKWRSAVGGMWNQIGTLQFNFLVTQGLLSHHRFLDVGCGSLRGGVHFIKYLQDGHYHGMDKNQDLLDKGRHEELPLLNLQNRKIQLSCRDDFQFLHFGEEFDFAIAQSVFTHLPWNSILRCLAEIKKVLGTEGKFFSTFFEDSDGSHICNSILHHPGGIITFSDQDPYHYKFSTFEELARRVQLKVRLLGDWDHPRNQKMMLFTHDC